MSAQSPSGIKILAKNRKAFHNYEFEDRFEAGIVLVGSEVKSIRDGRVNIGEGYAQFDEHGELYLHGAHVAEYPWANRFNHEPTRPRKLLLHKRELGRLSHLMDRSGYALVPLKLYLKKGRIKLELGLGKGKRQYDKRHTLKKQDAQREIERHLK